MNMISLKIPYYTAHTVWVHGTKGGVTGQVCVRFHYTTQNGT